MAEGGWCVCVFRGFGCEVEGVTGADHLLQVTILSISFFITKMSCRIAFLIALHDPGFSFNFSCVQSLPCSSRLNELQT